MSNSLWPHELQHARHLCPSLSSRVCSSSCPLRQWCHSTISSSVAPFSPCPPFFPASGSFPMTWLYTWGGQRIVASASILPMDIQGWFLLGRTGLISLLSRGLSGVFSSPTVQKCQFFSSRLRPSVQKLPALSRFSSNKCHIATFLPYLNAFR